jgi:hypothetical protein
MAPPAVKKPSKPVFKTSSPFTEAKWLVFELYERDGVANTSRPHVSYGDQEVITELLCK